MDEFLNLDYPLKITPFTDNDEKGFTINSPELPGLEVYGDTIEEALEEVNKNII